MHLVARKSHATHYRHMSIFSRNSSDSQALQRSPIWLLAIVFCLATAGTGAQKSATPQVEITADAGLYTLRAQYATLKQVLHSIAAAADFDLHIDGNLEHTKGSWSYQQMPIEHIIRRLVRNYSTVALYQSPTDGDTLRHLDKLWIYANYTAQHDLSAQVTIEVNEMDSGSQAQPAETSDNTKIHQIDRLEGLKIQRTDFDNVQLWR